MMHMKQSGKSALYILVIVFVIVVQASCASSPTKKFAINMNHVIPDIDFDWISRYLFRASAGIMLANEMTYCDLDELVNQHRKSFHITEAGFGGLCRGATRHWQVAEIRIKLDLLEDKWECLVLSCDEYDAAIDGIRKGFEAIAAEAASDNLEDEDGIILVTLKPIVPRNSCAYTIRLRIRQLPADPAEAIVYCNVMRNDKRG